MVFHKSLFKIMLSFVLIFIWGCSSKEMSFSELYLQSQKPDRITLRNNSNGKTKAITAPEEVDALMTQLNINLKKSGSQQATTGSNYSFVFYENDNEIVAVVLSGRKTSSNKTDGYYQSDVDLVQVLDDYIKKKGWSELLLDQK